MWVVEFNGFFKWHFTLQRNLFFRFALYWLLGWMLTVRKLLSIRVKNSVCFKCLLCFGLNLKDSKKEKLQSPKRVLPGMYRHFCRCLCVIGRHYMFLHCRSGSHMYLRSCIRFSVQFWFNEVLITFLYMKSVKKPI